MDTLNIPLRVAAASIRPARQEEARVFLLKGGRGTCSARSESHRGLLSSSWTGIRSVTRVSAKASGFFRPIASITLVNPIVTVFRCALHHASGFREAGSFQLLGGEGGGGGDPSSRASEGSSWAGSNAVLGGPVSLSPLLWAVNPRLVELRADVPVAV